MASTTGIHHITAIATDADRNIQFYTHILGLRLVKVTVNFDDPTAYHLYYGDTIGTPGSALTFFIWKNMPLSSVGTGQISRTFFSVPPGTLDAWKKHFQSVKQDYHPVKDDIFGPTLQFIDPDGMHLAIAEQTPDPKYEVWETQEISKEIAIRGFAGVEGIVADPVQTGAFVTDILGFETSHETAYQTGKQFLSLQKNIQPGRMGQGSVHHIAWQVDTDEAELMLRVQLLKAQREVTPMIDRTYFHSIYFREPNGILFEIATKEPGFLLDEPKDKLGSSLQLPEMYQAHRAEIEAALPQIHLPKAEKTR